MNALFKKLFVDRALVILFLCFLVVLLFIVYLLVRIGGVYQKKGTVFAPVINYEKSKARIKKITLRKKKDDSEVCLSISHNGEFVEQNCETGKVEKSGVLSSQEVKQLFSKLENGVFETLTGSYGGSLDSDYTLIIETTQGTKTIEITSGSGGPGLGLLEDLISQIEEKATELPPVPTPLNTTSPTPSPSAPFPSATAYPIVVPSTSPEPTPLPDGATPEPFSCDMLPAHSKAITVSGIVCLPQ